MYLTKQMVDKKFKDANKVILIQDKVIKEMPIGDLWDLIENYARSKASNAIAEDSWSGKIALDAETEYKKTRADIRGFLGLPPESE